jgi:hypothetical protein
MSYRSRRQVVRARQALGAYQVYATLFDKYPRPVPTPIENLRPARDTCEQCHWPERFSGDLVRTYHHFLSDEENSEYSVRVMLGWAAATPTSARFPASTGTSPTGRIHRHRPGPSRDSVGPPHRQWRGRQTEFRTPEFTDDRTHEIRTMDCMDCHNRPAHIYKKPNDAVDRALARVGSTGRCPGSEPRPRRRWSGIRHQGRGARADRRNSAPSTRISPPSLPPSRPSNAFTRQLLPGHEGRLAGVSRASRTQRLAGLRSLP